MYKLIILIILIILILLINKYNKVRICETMKSTNLKIGIFVISNGLNKNIDFPPYESRHLRKTYYKRFIFEKKIWLKYRDKHPNIDVHFLECSNTTKTSKKFNTEQINCTESYKPGIFNKTLEAYKKFDNYDFYIRTNLSTFIIYNTLINQLSSLRTDIPIYTGYRIDSFIQGTSIIMNKKTRDVFVDNNSVVNNDVNTLADDVLISMILRYKNIYPTNLKGLYYWNGKESNEYNKNIIDKHNYIFIRTKPRNIKYNQKSILKYLYRIYYT